MDKTYHDNQQQIMDHGYPRKDLINGNLKNFTLENAIAFDARL